MPLLPFSTANVWSITVVGRADGIVTVTPVNAPLHLHQKLMALLREHDRQVHPTVPDLARKA